MAKNIFIFFLFIAVLMTQISENTVLTQGCELDIRQLSEYHSILVRKNRNEFVYPASNDGIIRLKKDEEIEVWCPANGDTNIKTKNYVLANGQESAIVKCVNKNSFLQQNAEKFKCKFTPDFRVRRTNNRCSEGINYVEIGFQLTASRWLNIYKICHDVLREATLFSHYKLTKASNKVEPRKVNEFKSLNEYGFYDGKDVLAIYNAHKATIKRILGDQSFVNTYFPTQKAYLNKGHLAASSDFIYSEQQRASFVYLNVAPQYERFNSGNWNIIEMVSRAYASTLADELEVYTGAHGIMQLIGKRNHAFDIFLSNKAQYPSQKTIPVPKFFYKVLINNRQNSGVVIIGVNWMLNTLPANYNICTDVSGAAGLNNINEFDRNDLSFGYIYACSVRDFVQSAVYLRTSFGSIPTSIMRIELTKPLLDKLAILIRQIKENANRVSTRSDSSSRGRG